MLFIVLGSEGKKKGKCFWLGVCEEGWDILGLFRKIVFFIWCKIKNIGVCSFLLRRY